MKSEPFWQEYSWVASGVKTYIGIQHINGVYYGLTLASIGWGKKLFLSLGKPQAVG